MVAAAASLLLVGACDEARPVDPLKAGELDASIRFVSEFTRSQECSPLTDYVAPTIGSVYRYRRDDGLRSERSIMDVRGSLVTFEYRDLAQPRALPARRTWAGIFVAGLAGAPNGSTRYERDPMDVLAELRPGASESIGVRRSVRINGRIETQRFPTLIKFEACGTVLVSGRQVPVRVYRVSSASRVPKAAQGDLVRRSQTTYYLSEETGFPIVVQDRVTAVVERISVPSSATLS